MSICSGINHIHTTTYCVMTMYIRGYCIGSCGRSMVLTDSPELVNGSAVGSNAGWTSNTGSIGVTGVVSSGAAMAIGCVATGAYIALSASVSLLLDEPLDGLRRASLSLGAMLPGLGLPR